MNRRASLNTLSVGLLAAPLGAEAQQARKVYQIGIVTLGTHSRQSALWRGFLEPLRDLDYVEGRRQENTSPAWVLIVALGDRVEPESHLTVHRVTQGYISQLKAGTKKELGPRWPFAWPML